MTSCCWLQNKSIAKPKQKKNRSKDDDFASDVLSSSDEDSSPAKVEELLIRILKLLARTKILTFDELRHVVHCRKKGTRSLSRKRRRKFH
jgi:hypothetical protein